MKATAADEAPYICMDRYMIFTVEDEEVLQGVKFIYSFRVAFALLFATYLLYATTILIVKFR